LRVQEAEFRGRNSDPDTGRSEVRVRGVQTPRSRIQARPMLRSSVL